MTTTDPNAWNKQVVEEFRANGGNVGGVFQNMPLLLLTNTGAKSGQQRINPLAYLQEGEHIYIFASKGGAPTNPDWYRNIIAHPDVTVEIGTEKFNAKAVEITGEERDEVYTKMAQHAPQFGEYEQKTTRVIPVVELVRQ